MLQASLQPRSGSLPSNKAINFLEKIREVKVKRGDVVVPIDMQCTRLKAILLAFQNCYPFKVTCCEPSYLLFLTICLTS